MEPSRYTANGHVVGVGSGGETLEGHVVVNLELAAGAGVSHAVAAAPEAAKPREDAVADGGAGAAVVVGSGAGGDLCARCRKPMEWVAVGRCGHRSVCRACMVRLRFFDRSKRCPVCRAWCATVVVVPISSGACCEANAKSLLSKLPLLPLRGGRVGKHWYHRDTTAYFEDKQEYIAAMAACEGILPPCYAPWYIIGVSPTDKSTHATRCYVVGLLTSTLLATIVWSWMKCTRDPSFYEPSPGVEIPCFC
ncbi:hypothetical protein ACP4OV_028226 [Aristida adscensionis]